MFFLLKLLKLSQHTGLFPHVFTTLSQPWSLTRFILFGLLLVTKNLSDSYYLELKSEVVQILCLCLRYNKMRKRWENKILLTSVAQTKHVVTTLEITFINVFVSLMTLSTLVNVAAFPTVGFLTVNCNCCTCVGTWSSCSINSFLWEPAGTCWYEKAKYKKLCHNELHAECNPWK